MNTKLYAFAIILLALPLMVSAQQQTGGVPLSFGRALNGGNILITEIAAPAVAVIREYEKTPSLPYRFAINLPVDISMTNSGTTEILKDGFRVWRFSLRSAGALGLILCFDRFRIPEGGKLYVYNPSRTQMYGAYTSANINSFNTFACPLINGDAVVLEYNSPSDIPVPDLHLSEVAYAFRGVSLYDENHSVTSSGKCEVNVFCSEGDNWQKQIRGVVKLLIKDSLGTYRLCSGSLVNNTNNDGTPYILTADHCGRLSRPVDLSQWLFYFNYEMPGCPNTSALPGVSLLGATWKANGGTEATGSDFYLVRLSESIPDSLHPYFNGWSREDISSPSGTGIHHPAGDVKKISTYTTPLITAHYSINPYPCHWEVVWAQTANGHGVTEGGSSGSPIFNTQGQIVGTLTGGDSACDSNSLNQPDYYGKFSWHWDKNGSDSTSTLKYWLDPAQTGVMSMGGWALGVSDQAGNDEISLFPNPASDNATLTLNDKLLSREGIHITILDILGKPCTLWNKPGTSDGTYHLELQSLTPGIYVIIISAENYRKNIKLVKI